MKPVDVKPSTCFYLMQEKMIKIPKFEVSDPVRISKYKNMLTQSYSLNQAKNTAQWRYVIKDLNGGEIAEKFYEKELRKVN